MVLIQSNASTPFATHNTYYGREDNTPVYIEDLYFPVTPRLKRPLPSSNATRTRENRAQTERTTSIVYQFIGEKNAT
jgi:hypothetical protein